MLLKTAYWDLQPSGESTLLLWQLERNKPPPDPALADFGGPNGRSPHKQKTPEKMGGFAPRFFRWPFGRERAAWTPQIDDFWVQGDGVCLLISQITWADVKADKQIYPAAAFSVDYRPKKPQPDISVYLP